MTSTLHPLRARSAAVHIYNELADYERLAAAVLRIAAQQEEEPGTS